MIQCDIFPSTSGVSSHGVIILVQVSIHSETNLSIICSPTHIVTMLAAYDLCLSVLEVSCAPIIEPENRYHKNVTYLCRTVHVPLLSR
jgi:hypothetical protein